MSEAQSGKKFLERPLAVVTLIASLLGIATAVVTLSGIAGGDENGKLDRIGECISEHGLAQASERKDVAEGRVLFRACEDPPPPGAASDGFTEITVASNLGPGESEAEGLTIAEVFTSTCRDIEASYLFDNMGTFVPEQPVRLTKGEVRRVEGGSIWFPRDEQEAQIYAPGRDEFIVMSAGRYKLDSARCVG